MNLVRVFQPRRKQKGEGVVPAGRRESRPTHRPKLQEQQRKSRDGLPVLDRCNASKNTNYESWAVNFDSIVLGAAAGDKGRLVHSLDVPPSAASAPGSPLVVHLASQTSFRISGDVEGEFDVVCQSLGVSGPDDFAITPADWETALGISSSDVLSGSNAPHANHHNNEDDDDTSMHPGAAVEAEDDGKTPREEPRSPPQQTEAEEEGQESHHAMGNRFRFEVAVTNAMLDLVNKPHYFENTVGRRNRGGGIRGIRPSPLAPPPPMSLPPLNGVKTTWDIFRSLGPEDGQEGGGATREGRENPEEKDKATNEKGDRVSFGKNVELEVDKWVRMGLTSTDLTASCSFCTSYDDDSSSTTTEGMSTISPNGKLRRDIRSWEKGQLLGSGSFGTVYEAMSDDGFFFAVKEVYLLDEGTNTQQCINQLEQEVALLSQFEHENIVHYLGTAKEEAKLCIFLELVSQGSLASLYQKYHLRDSQVSAYTRQILNGLRYLHDRNVVHRDIKCSNILVAANGSVKLADFGLAKKRTQFSDLKSCKGSVYWMAPEVVIPRRTYGPSADIWSLGCTVLEMLTQQHPFPDLEWTQALFYIGRGGQPPIPDSLSRDACDFIQQCTQVNPDDRPSASKLLDHPFVKRPLPTSSSDSAMTCLQT